MLGKVCNENNPINAQKRYFQLPKEALSSCESGTFDW
jgi:hypothetical protein